MAFLKRKEFKKPNENYSLCHLTDTFLTKHYTESSLSLKIGTNLFGAAPAASSYKRAMRFTILVILTQEDYSVTPWRKADIKKLIPKLKRNQTTCNSLPNYGIFFKKMAIQNWTFYNRDRIYCSLKFTLIFF